MGILEKSSEDLSADQELDRVSIFVDPFEVGVLMIVIGDHPKLQKVMEQLEAQLQKWKDDAGVEVTRVGNRITMKDKEGYEHTRDAYPWEK